MPGDPCKAFPGSAPNSASPAPVLLEARAVVKEFRLEGHAVQVLCGADLAVRAGEWVALVGPSGSGKTTLLHLLAALDAPTSGHIACRGVSYQTLRGPARARLRRQTIGLVFQAYHLFPELNAIENVMLPGLYPGRNKKALRAQAAAWLEKFGLGRRFRHRPRELSGGEQQRVALARALINDPEVILADEPTGNLDADSAAIILRIFEELHASGKTLVMVTHDPHLAEHADRILLIRDGRLTEASRPA